MNIEEFEKWVNTKKFFTRGLPFAKKMWRDGYNKALDDCITYFKIQKAMKGGEK